MAETPEMQAHFPAMAHGITPKIQEQFSAMTPQIYQ